MRIVVALGDNAFLRPGQPMTDENLRANIRRTAESLATIAAGNELVITHGNSPQVALLAFQAGAYEEVEGLTLDVLGSQTEGMIGYLIEQELGNLLPYEAPFATILTMVEVDPSDPAFQDPTKFIGPVYEEEEAKRLAKEMDWLIRQDGNKWRRVVASPKPKKIFEIQPIRWLLERETIVICAGGGGIPTAYDGHRKLHGIEAVIDKDLASELLARELEADLFIMATDADGVYIGWNTPEAKAIKRANPEAIGRFDFPAGSMGPKVEAACQFAEQTGKAAASGALEDLKGMVEGSAGTIVSAEIEGLDWH